MQERHDILSRTIGYLEEEQEALDRGYLLLIGSTVTMVVGSLLQILFFYLYNGPFHPFANILVDEEEGKDQCQTYFSHHLEFLLMFCFTIYIECLTPEKTTQDDTVMNKLPSACDQSTQTENAFGFSRNSCEENILEEQGQPFPPNKSQNETKV